MKTIVTLQELYSSMQKRVDSARCVKSLAHNIQVSQFPNVIMMTLPKRRLRYRTIKV